MSHSLLFMRYVDGKPAPFDLDKLRSILIKHGGEVGGPHDSKDGVLRYWVRFPARDDGDDIAGDESGIYADSQGAIEFAIGQPVYYERLKNLSFEILQTLDVCMHPDFGEEVFTVHLQSHHLPKDLLESCEKGLIVVTNPGDLW